MAQSKVMNKATDYTTIVSTNSKNNAMTQQIFNWIISIALTVGFSSCDGQGKKDLPKEIVSESKIISIGQPTLVKIQGSDGGNVHYRVQDKAGNLWFGTTGDGVYKYDGESFTQFTATDGLYSNTVWCILEDKDGKIWIGTDAGASYYDGRTFSKIQITLSNASNLVPTTLQNTTQPNRYDVEVFSIMQDKSEKYGSQQLMVFIVTMANPLLRL